MPSVLAISKWFVRRRLFANSMAQLGACLGAALYPICSELILRRYNLFDTLLILAGVQLNCLVGSVLLRDDNFSSSSSSPSSLPNSPNQNKSNAHNYTGSSVGGQQQQQPCCRAAQDAAMHRKNRLKATSAASKKSSSSAALLIENEHHLSSMMASPPRRKFNRPGGAYHFHQNYLDASETESTISVSTTTVPNYTLKQYWRKFIQTRKSTSNGKKNLFHLIAEEKRKTRTLSKTSLEDGFVITTSNNLLAPNDDSHVIVSRQSKLHNEKTGLNPEVTSISATSRASKFFSRIANSLRSLAHVGGGGGAASSSQAVTSSIAPPSFNSLSVDPESCSRHHPTTVSVTY